MESLNISYYRLCSLCHIAPPAPVHCDERSYPVSEVRGGGPEEIPHAPKPEAKGSGGKEQPHD